MRARVGRLENDAPSSLTCLNARTVGARLSVHLDGAAPCPRDVTLSAYRSKKFVHGQQHDITARDIQRRDMASGVFSFPNAIDTFCPLSGSGSPARTRSPTCTACGWNCGSNWADARLETLPTRRLGVGGDV